MPRVEIESWMEFLAGTGRGAVTDTEPIPKLVVGNTELVVSKLKKGKGFLKPNFELGPNQGAGRLLEIVCLIWAARSS